MPLITHSGAGSTDLGATGTIRQDISDLLLASLVTENNFIGSLDVGAEFGDTVLRWVEDTLNPQTVTDNTSGGLTNSATAWTVNTTADAAVLEIGAIVIDDTIGDYVAGEQMQVTAIAGTAITITRGYGGTTAVTHANGSIFRVIARPTYENSDLGRDLSRARLAKSNIIGRFERNVNLSAEVLLRAKYGYAPGVGDELKYQFEQRIRELLREMNNAAISSRQASGGTTTGDYATMAGVIAMLDTTFNSTATPSNQAGAVLTDTVVNTVNRTIINNGAVPDWIFLGTLGADNLSKLYNDRIRIVQDDTTRGFRVQEFTATLQNTLRIMWDKQIQDTQGKGIAFMLDSSRVRIRPFIESLGYTIQAPSFRDGDAIRFLSKWSLEMRNTGTDAGAAHVMIYNLSF